MNKENLIAYIKLHDTAFANTNLETYRLENLVILKVNIELRNRLLIGNKNKSMPIVGVI